MIFQSYKLLLPAATLLAASGGIYPAQAADGCYAQVLVPATYRPSSETVTTYEASPSYATAPVQMGEGERRVKVADGYIEYEVIPAKFEEVTETIEVERERTEIDLQPATYRTETKRVKTKDATVAWNPKCPLADTADTSSIPSNCLIDVPAEYTEVARQVVEMPPRSVKKIIPGKTQTVTRKVLVEPAKVVRKQIDPVYETIKVSRVDQPMKVQTTPGQAQTVQVATQQTLAPAHFARQPVPCGNGTNALKPPEKPPEKAHVQ